jgi:hypothetical protein
MDDAPEPDVEVVGRMDVVDLAAGWFAYLDIDCLVFLCWPTLMDASEDGSAMFSDVSYISVDTTNQGRTWIGHIIICGSRHIGKPPHLATLHLLTQNRQIHHGKLGVPLGVVAGNLLALRCDFLPHKGISIQIRSSFLLASQLPFRPDDCDYRVVPWIGQRVRMVNAVYLSLKLTRTH